MRAATCFGLLQRRECMLPTWRGWVALGLICSGAMVGAVGRIHQFLAVNAPLSGGVLIVEGWIPDYGLEEAVSEFKRNRYSMLFITGGPLESGAPLSEYKTYAERGMAIVVRLGLGTNFVRAVPAPHSSEDRTYATAVALRQWLERHGMAPESYHVMSLGTHARRTRLLFEKALGRNAKIGITAIVNRAYDASQWWNYSAGVRAVLAETVAYAYARLHF